MSDTTDNVIRIYPDKSKPETVSEVLDPKVLAWAARIADLLNTSRQYANQDTDYGEFYVEKVVLGFDGETLPSLSVAADEFGGYGVRVEVAVPHPQPTALKFHYTKED